MKFKKIFNTIFRPVLRFQIKHVQKKISREIKIGKVLQLSQQNNRINKRERKSSGRYQEGRKMYVQIQDLTILGKYRWYRFLKILSNLKFNAINLN